MNRKIIYLSLFVVFFAFPSYSSDGKITFENAWLRAAPPVAKALAGYVTIHNGTQKDVRIVSVQSDVSHKAEVHRTMKKDGMMMMEETSLVIPAQGKVVMKPGGFHFMFMKPKKVPKEGESVKITIEFSNGHSIPLDLPVRKSQP